MPREHGVGDAEFSSLEQLLSEAATWEPDAPAPEGLAGKALASELERQERERILRVQERRAGLFATFFLGASAVSATVALAFFHLSPTAPVRPDVSTPGPARTAGAKGGSQAADAGPLVAVVPTLPPNPVPAVPAGAPGRRRARRSARLAGTAARPSRGEERASEAPTALWREETVRREITGVLSTGWLVGRNPEDGSVILLPGVLEVQSAGADAACESPAGAAEAIPPAAIPAVEAPLLPEPVSEDAATSGDPRSEAEPDVPVEPES